MAFTTTITSPPMTPDAGLPGAIKVSLAKHAGPDGNFPYGDIGEVGTLDALLSDANTSGYIGVGDVVFRKDGQNKGRRRVDFLYHPRVAASAVSNSDAMCDRTDCNGPVRKAGVISLDQTRSICGTMSRAEMQEFLSSWYDENRNLPFDQKIENPTIAEGLEYISGFLLDNLRSLREQVNDAVAAQLATLAPTFIAAGPTPPVPPIQIAFTDNQGNTVWPGAFGRMGEFLQELNMRNAIVLTGKNSLSRALWAKQYLTSSNIDGFNVASAAATLGSQINEGQVYVFHDRMFNATFGANQFIAWDKGALQLFYFAEFDEGSIALPRYGSFADGDIMRFSLPDPKHGAKFKYDVQITYDPCARDAETGLLGAYKFVIRASWGLFAYPVDIWPTGHPFNNTRRALWFEATTQNACVEECP